MAPSVEICSIELDAQIAWCRPFQEVDARQADSTLEGRACWVRADVCTRPPRRRVSDGSRSRRLVRVRVRGPELVRQASIDPDEITGLIANDRGGDAPGFLGLLHRVGRTPPVPRVFVAAHELLR